MASETLEIMWNIMKGNEFQTDVAINSELSCTSCKNIMVKACNVPCGCRYCFDCLKRYLNDEEKFCIGQSDYCTSELINIDKNVFIDQAVNMKISRIAVKCALESCEFIGELGKMADHMRTCNRQPVACPYYTIGCEKNKIGGDKLIQHFKEENVGHARLLMNFVDNWKNEMNSLKTAMLDLQEENKWIKEQMESKQETISALQENLFQLIDEKRTLKELETEKCHQSRQAEKVILALQTKSKEQNEEIEKNKKRLDEIEIKQGQARSSNESMNKENTSLRLELEMIKLDNKAKEEMISALQTKSQEEEEEIRKMREKCEFLEKKQDEQENGIEELLLEIKSLKVELGTAKLDMTKQETFLSFKKRLEEQEKTIKRNTERTEDWRQKIDEKCDQVENKQKQMETKHDKMTKENGTMKGSIDKMTKENGTMKGRIDKLTKENGTMKGSIDKMTKENGTMKGSIDKMTKENAATTTKSEQSENKIKIIETKLTQIQANQNCSEFLWCIQNWDKKKERARNGIETEIFSDPFYSHKNGYKMCLRLDPDGYGEGKKTHLSLFLCVMRGEFDNILQWPFRHEVKLELLDQNTGLPHHSRILTSDENPTLISYVQKPCLERNIGFGFPHFIELSKLSSNAALCQGNQIWFRATPQIKP